MNRCRELEPLFSALLDDELDASQRDLAVEHLTSCRHCARRHMEFQQVDTLLSRPAVMPSDSLRARVSAIPRQARRRSIRRLALASAAALLLTAGGFWWQTTPAIARPTPDAFESLQLIHRVQERTQQSTLKNCEWDLRLLKLQVDRLAMPPGRKIELLARIEQLMQRVRQEQSLPLPTQPGA